MSTESVEGNRRAFCVFAVLWAIAPLFEYARSLNNYGPLGVVLVILLGRSAALWVLARPAAVTRLLMLCAVLIAIVSVKLPKSPNHGIFVMVASATILFAALRVRLAGVRVTPAALYAAFAPALRWELIALYFWGAVQKLNTDFFALDLSCGPAQIWNLHRLMEFIPTGHALGVFGVHGTLLVETGIPCLLILRRTRYLGIALGMGFHFTLGANYTGFSAMLFAMLALFAPSRFYASLWRFWEQLFGRLSGLGSMKLLDNALSIGVCGLAVTTVAVLLLFSNTIVDLGGPPLLSRDGMLVIWLVVGPLAMLIFAIAAWGARPWASGERPSLALRYWSLALFPALVFLNGMAPHLGLKNTQVLAMFSNLQTGGGVTNHLIFSSAWQRWNFLDDLVTIRESNDPVLAKLVGPSWKTFNYFTTYIVDRPKMERTQKAPTWQLPYVALRRRVTDLARAGRTGIEIVFERNGVTRRVENAETDPELSSLPLLQRKLQLLRAVPSTRRGYCMW